MLNLLGLYVHIDGRLVMCGAGDNVLCVSVTLLVETHLQNLHRLLRLVRVFRRLVLPCVRDLILLIVRRDALHSLLSSLLALRFAHHQFTLR